MQRVVRFMATPYSTLEEHTPGFWIPRNNLRWNALSATKFIQPMNLHRRRSGKRVRIKNWENPTWITDGDGIRRTGRRIGLWRTRTNGFISNTYKEHSGIWD